MCLPPTWACLYLCVAGFHFNGSNLRMRQCHFYEVGVKKIYSLFQKAFFFFFSKGERCRITLGGFYGLNSPTLFAPLLCVISVLCLFAGGQSLAGGEPGSPHGQYLQRLGPLTSDLSPCAPSLHSLVPSRAAFKEWMERCLIQVLIRHLLFTTCESGIYLQRLYHFLNSLYSLT